MKLFLNIIIYMTSYNSDGQPIHNNKINASSAEGMAVYADSMPAPTGDPNGRKGWYFKKTTGAEKFNYYLYAEGSRAVRLQDVKEYFFVGSIDTWTNGASAPFIVVYTKMLGDGNDAGAWYRSKIHYAIHSSSALVQLGIKSQFSTVTNTSTKFPYSQNHLSVVGGEGPRAPTEEILTMSVQSDSGAVDDTTILITNFGYTLHNRSEDVNIILIA
tara:strand:+ start:1099 stop:1743 length:645 start_codon:yes stop_codon:yes gene_type:complete